MLNVERAFYVRSEVIAAMIAHSSMLSPSGLNICPACACKVTSRKVPEGDATS